MLEIRYKEKWVKFLPILSLDFAGEGATYDTRKLAELPEKIYGKYVGGVAGYNVWWINDTIDKKMLREVEDRR